MKKKGIFIDFQKNITTLAFYAYVRKDTTMPERIFPTQLKEQLGSKLEFNGIDIDTLVTKLAETQEDSKKDTTLLK